MASRLHFLQPAALITVALLSVFVSSQAKVVMTDNSSSPAQPIQAESGLNLDTMISPEMPSVLTEKSKPRHEGSARATSLAVQLGLSKLHGIGMPVDIKQAGQDFMRAYAVGDPRAPAAVALCHLMGCYGQPDPRLVAVWIDRTRTREPAKAKLLDWASFEQLAKHDVAKAGKAAALLLIAVRAQDAVALNEQGLRQVSLGQRQAALVSFKQASLRGSAAAERNFNLLTQLETESTNARAFHAKPNLSASPATSGVAGQLAFELAQKYHVGQGLPINYVQAIQYYKQAADAGHLRAKKMVELIFSRLDRQGLPDNTWMRQLATDNIFKQPHNLEAGVMSRGILDTQVPTVWLQRDISFLADWLPFNL